MVPGKRHQFVIPAQAGIQNDMPCRLLDSGLRRNDEEESLPATTNGGEKNQMLRRLLLLLPALALALLIAGGGGHAADEAGRTEKRAFVTVADAPGDGEKVLAAAVSRRLAKKGFKQATAFEASIYEVQGSVRLNPGPGNKQTVKIVWVVFDPNGKQLGVVSQEKVIRNGSLDKRWGGAADAAAQAAVADILGLLPRE